jgi:hypothetical protein
MVKGMRRDGKRENLWYFVYDGNIVILFNLKIFID